MTYPDADPDLRARLRDIAQSIEPEALDSRRILASQRRRPPSLIVASSLAVVLVVGIAVAAATVAHPGRKTGSAATTPSVRSTHIDPKVLATVRRIAGIEGDSTPRQIRYVDASSEAAAPFLDDVAAGSPNGVVLVLADGHFTQNFLPSGAAPTRFPTLIMELDRSTKHLISWRTSGTSPDNRQLQKLGGLTTCALGPSKSGPITHCTNS